MQNCKMFRISQFLLPLSLAIMAKLATGDSNARIQSRLTAPHPPRLLVSKAVPDKPSRRTFVTAILAAEVAYLESLLSKQNQKKKQKPKHPKGVSNHIHRPKKVRPRPQKPAPAHEKPPSTTTEYVSKLDPFYMITAPDLSVKSESYKSSPAAEYSAPAPPPPPVTEVAPLPTYGAYQEYKVVPSAAPQSTEKTTEKPSTTTLKYGDFELYQPKGYLPPSPPKKVAKPPAYKAPQKPEPKPVTYRPKHSYLPPTKKKPKTIKPHYKPSKGYLPPVKQSKPSYKLPAKHQAPASPPKYKAPASPLKQKSPPPVTYRPVKGYLPPVKQSTASSYKAPEQTSDAPEQKAPAPNTEIPKYEAPQESTTSKKVTEGEAYEAPASTTTTIPVYKPSSPPPRATYNPNPHPHTFFHDAQAEKVHKGDWPPIYYNSLHGTERKRRRL